MALVPSFLSYHRAFVSIPFLFFFFFLMMDGGASNSCPAEWKSRNINFDFYKIKRDLFTGRPMRWLTSQRVSIGRSWVKSDSLQNPLHSTGGSSWLRCRTSFPPPAEIFFLYFHHLFFAFLSDLYWLAHQTESERQLAHDTDFFQRKTSPLLRRWTHQTFPDIFFFSPDCPSLSLMAAFLSTDSFVPSAVRVLYGAKNFHYNDQVMNILLLFKRKTHRLRLPLRWAPKREARPPAALISASVGILWEPKTTKHFDIVHTRLLIDSIPVQNRKFFCFGFFFFLLQNELARVKSSKGREIELLSWRRVLTDGGTNEARGRMAVNDRMSRRPHRVRSKRTKSRRNQKTTTTTEQNSLIMEGACSCSCCWLWIRKCRTIEQSESKSCVIIICSFYFPRFSHHKQSIEETKVAPHQLVGLFFFFLSSFRLTPFDGWRGDMT